MMKKKQNDGFWISLLMSLSVLALPSVSSAAQTNVIVIGQPIPSGVLTNGAYININPPNTNLTTLSQYPYTNRSDAINLYTLTAVNGTGYIFWEWLSSEDKYNHNFNPQMPVKFDANASASNAEVIITVTPNYITLGQDTDGDGMPDWWERNYKLEYRLYDDEGKPVYGNVGDNGASGNSDGDLLPGSTWPLGMQDDCLFVDYLPKDTAPFKNILEFSGFDGVYGTSDDPGTDPTQTDTDEDTLPDGWEYYFWALRGGGSTNPLPWVYINPLISSDADHIDDDGDGLTNQKEFELGTDPTHCDTDRDGIDDWWEVQQGLNPLNRCDADENPDGDQMADDGTFTHDQVYRKSGIRMEAGETAFDPRTAWVSLNKVEDHPNTRKYKNLDEYLGRDRVGRIQWDSDGHKIADASDDDTNPNKWDTDDDEIPDGWELYVGMNPKDDVDRDLDGDRDEFENIHEWQNMRDEHGGAANLGAWTNKLWPTDPGVIQDGLNYATGTIVFAWRNVWVKTNVVAQYQEGRDYRVFYGANDRDALWTNAPDGSIGINPDNFGGIYYNDRNNNSNWNWGEEIWLRQSGGPQYVSGVDVPIGTHTYVWNITSSGTNGTRTGLYFRDINNNGQYDFGENIWREDYSPVNTYDSNTDIPVWAGGHQAGFTAPDGAAGNPYPVYYDWFINRWVGIYWSSNGAPVSGPTGPFNPANAGVWLDYNNNGTNDGEIILRDNGSSPLVRQSYSNGQYGVQGKGLMYVWCDGTINNVWHLPAGIGTAVAIKGAVGIPVMLMANVVFQDSNNDGVYNAGEPAWIDDIVRDGLYTHDLQIWPATNAIPSAQWLSNGVVGTRSDLYFYHNDPHPLDTDFDGLEDGEGRGYPYAVIPYGEKSKLSNPTCVDSDGDALPDGWEVYAGTQILIPDASPAQTQNVELPADNTDEENIVLLELLGGDPLSDPDQDGLVNNQEYFTGVNYEWMHIDIRKFPNTKLCTRQPMIWDMQKEGEKYSMRSWWLGVYIPPDFVTCPSFDVSHNQRARTTEPYVFYHTTKANKADTDDDGMDDYWEVYHGLNPLKGAADYMSTPLVKENPDGARSRNSGAQVGLVTLTNDFRESPYLKFGNSLGEFTSISNLIRSLASHVVSDHVGPFNFGLELMDPDADGLPNLEEYSYESTTNGRSFYHSDPTPMIRTDIGTLKELLITRPSNYSFTRDNYTFDNIECPCKWRWIRDSQVYPLNFEQVEGYDSDNDIFGDHAELMSTIPDATGGSDPIDSLDPIRNRAILLIATNRDFVRTMDSWVVNTPNHLTRFDVEAWVMPVSITATNQTVVERATQFPSDWFGSLTRANFRVGLTSNNIPYVMYNGRGPYEAFYAVAPYSYRVLTNQWTHLSATYDGTKLRLFVNGQIARVVDSEVIPATGYNHVLAQRKLSTTIIGAREPDNTNDLWGTPIPLFTDDVTRQGVRYGTAGYSLYTLSLQGERPRPVYATEFFNGYIDEVRIWNGSRSQGEIQSKMALKIARTESSSSATIAYYYGFDDCPDVDIHWTNSLGQAIASEPRIPANISVIQRPGMAIHRTIPAWDLAPQKSQVYYGSANNPLASNRWNYIVFAEDLALHRAVNPPIDDKYHPERDANGVFTGMLPADYKNPSNPYHDRYDTTRWAWERPVRDLVFMNGAQADGDIFVNVGAWYGENISDPDASDADGDEMPDNWETAHGLDPNDSTGNNGANGDLDGDGLSNVFEYRAGLDPNNSDSNGDGIGDAHEDLDADGLFNTTEQNLGTLPLKADTDDDGLTDGEEYTGTDNMGSTVTPQAPIGTSDPLNSLDPPVRRAMSFSGNGRVIIPPQDKYMSDKWTIEMWVNPDAAGDGGVLVSRYVQDLVSGASGINYEMGLTPAGAGLMRPYVRYVTRDGTIIRLDGTGSSDVLPPGVSCDCVISVDQWSHLASVYSITNNRLELYIDGKLRAYRQDATAVPPTSFGLNSVHRGDEVTLGAARSTVAIATDGYEGLLDEFKFFDEAKSAADVEKNFNAPPSGSGGLAPYMIRYRNRLYTPDEGMAAELSGLPSDQVVNAVVQLWALPTEDTVQTLQNNGLQVLYRVGSRGYAVRGTSAQIAGLGAKVRSSGIVDAQDKISSAIGSSGVQPGRWVLAQFFVGTPLSNALAAAQAAGANIFGNKYLAGTYMLVEADDTQVQALAEDNSVAWIGKAATNLMTGARLIDDNESVGLSPAPFTTPSVGWDGDGLGSADLGYFFYNGTDKIPGTSENDAIVEQMMKWARYAAISWSQGSFEQDFSSDVFWASVDGTNGILAYAYYPNDLNPETVAGDLTFDADEDWHLGSDIDLNFVALHELGHVLGVGHSDDPTALMYPFYHSGMTDLQPDDIAAIQSIYAKPNRPRASFRFDDGGMTAQDIEASKDWLRNWAHAGRLDGDAVFSTNAVPLDGDSDSDGIPDWWEISHGLDPLKDGDAALDPDGDQLINLNEYRAGTNPHAKDSDLDGLDDWYDDSDGDTLCNGSEQDEYASNLGLADTDDDSLNDRYEVTNATDPSNSISPYVVRSLRFGTMGTLDGQVTVRDRIRGHETERLSCTNFTIECWVRPTVALPAAGDLSLVSRSVTCSGKLNYELGLTASGRPYIRFNDCFGANTPTVIGGESLGSNDWTHLAGRFSGGVLTLFVSGVPVSSDNTGFVPALGAGDLKLGSAGFKGDLKEVRIWKVGRSDTDIYAFKNRTLFFGSSAADPGLLRLQGNGSLRQISAKVDPTDGEFYDDLEYWTLECWVRTRGSGCLISRWNTSIDPDNEIDFNYFMGIDPEGRLIGRFSSEYLAVDSDEITIDHESNEIIGAMPINDGEWHHVAYVRNQTNVILYVDGELDTKAPSMLIPAGVNIVWVRVRSLDGPVVDGTGLVGDVDEIRTWKRGLSPQEILQYYGENLLGDEPGLISYFNFDSQFGANAKERALVRDPITEYGRYIPNAVHVRTQMGPPIQIIPLRTYRLTSLIGYYAADDGGLTVEDFIYRNDLEYAGILTNDVAFYALSNADVPFDADSDSDGLPDWWETANGLDPGSSIGDDGTWGDPDQDGLNNRAEYLAGTDPWDFDTYNTGFSDYDSRTNAGSRTFGELHTDGDGMDDGWESLYSDDYISPLKYDAQVDRDIDGWDNYSEYMYQSVDTNGVTHRSTDPTDNNSYPKPKVTFTFKDADTNTIGLLRVMAYHSATMDGNPDATHSFMISSNFNSSVNFAVSTFNSGHLRQGDTWFHAYLDRNNDGTWNEGEPAGLAQGQPINVSWGDVNNVVIGLTDHLQGYGRFSWTAVAGASSYTVAVRNISVSGSPLAMPLRSIKSPRTYFHEGDFRYVGSNGLPHAGYQWFVYVSNGSEVASGYFNVLYPTSQSTPIPLTPVGEVIFARNEFSWFMDTNATQFRLQIATNAAFSALVYDAITHAPYFDANGKFSYYPPLYAGDGWFTNAHYWWRLQGINPRVNSSISAAQTFSVNLQESPVGAYTIRGNVYYFGKVTNASYVVQAYTSRGYSLKPDAQVTVAYGKSVAFKLMGLRAGTYYVMAFLDQNGNKKLDAWESFGFIKSTSPYAVDYDPKALTVPGNVSGERVVIRDRDTDGDRIPDAWEYRYFGNLTTASGEKDGETDFDGDGLTDLREYEIEPADTDPTKVDTDGDGISDYNEVWWDGNGDYNPYDPVTNPTGTDLNPHQWSTDGSAVSDGDQDADGDGLSNILELAMGTGPRTFTDLFSYLSVIAGSTQDIVSFNIADTVTNMVTIFTVRPMWTTNLLASWYPASNGTQVVNGSNWRNGPWVKTNSHAIGTMMFYRLDWTSP